MSRSGSRPGTGLLDRHGERAVLDGVLDQARGGSSAVLVVRGEPGIGKTALLDYAAGRAVGFRVVRAWGVESEMELAFAGLHQLCVPMLGRLDQLPGPQRDALAVAFGMREGPAPDRFLVGLAVLSLLAATAEDQPLACLVDDAQWLDRASVQCLAFAARRLLAEPVAVIFAARQPDDRDELAGLPGLTVTGLGDVDARCWPRRSAGGWTQRCVTGSWPRPAATRSRCCSCLAGWGGPSWRAVSGFPTRGRWPAASRPAFSGSSGRFRARRSGCC
jgi:hypothetical protein